MPFVFDLMLSSDMWIELRQLLCKESFKITHVRVIAPHHAPHHHNMHTHTYTNTHTHAHTHSHTLTLTLTLTHTHQHHLPEK